MKYAILFCLLISGAALLRLAAIDLVANGYTTEAQNAILERTILLGEKTP